MIGENSPIYPNESVVLAVMYNDCRPPNDKPAIARCFMQGMVLKVLSTKVMISSMNENSDEPFKSRNDSMLPLGRDVKLS